MTTYYRGDTARPAAPALAAGTWLTPDPDVACWYGAAYRYDPVEGGRRPAPDLRGADLVSETPKVPKVLDLVADKVLGYRPKEAKKKLRKKARKPKKKPSKKT